ncbi:MAG: SDR family NAD(P)-dependent oxidoreductase [Methyloligellaceae bacterium]
MNGSNNLEGRVAVVTGGGSGLGRATALEFAKEGAHVIVVGRTQSTLEAVVNEIKVDGGSAQLFVADITDYAPLLEFMSGLREEGKTASILINNAGQIDPIGRFLDTDPEVWKQNVMVNLVGAQNAARAFLTSSDDMSNCILVNISTGAARVPREGWSGYCCSKAAVAMFTQHLHSEYGDEGLRVMGYIPGFVDTEMQEKIRASGINEISQMTKQDMTSPAIPAQVIAFLCSPDGIDYAGQEVSFQDEALMARVFP